MRVSSAPYRRISCELKSFPCKLQAATRLLESSVAPTRYRPRCNSSPLACCYGRLADYEWQTVNRHACLPSGAINPLRSICVQASKVVCSGWASLRFPSHPPLVHSRVLFYWQALGCSQVVMIASNRFSTTAAAISHNRDQGCLMERDSHL